MYFKLGVGASGWSLEYWNKIFEKNEDRLMKYLVEEPKSPEETRMMIVTDYAVNEYRLFFLTEEAAENFFDFPGKDCSPRRSWEKPKAQ